MKLKPPKTEIEIIAYQTILPYYRPGLLEEYELVVPGSGAKIFAELNHDIDHLIQSKKKWDAHFPNKSWTEHLKNFGYNISGKYQYATETPILFSSTTARDN